LTGGFDDKIQGDSLFILKTQDYQEIKQKGIKPYCFVVGSNDGLKALTLIKNLRADPKLGLIPLFSFTSFGDPTDRLLDAIVKDVKEATEKAADIIQALKKIDVEYMEESGSDTYRMLALLYSRPVDILVPYRHWQNESYYRFPLIDAIFGGVTGSALIEGLLDRKLVETSQLIDRLRLCPKCNGAHLNYIDVCPNCGAIDIIHQPFLHCFACGHVAPEKSFFTQDALICPNCKGRLRHIGSDYDRPLENFHCRECGHIFVEPAVSCHCMHCGTASDPDALAPRPIYSYQLTEKGRISATTGSVEDIFSLFDNLNYVNPIVFESILDWLLSLCRRHTDEHFSLIAIRMVNLIELADKIGRHKTKELIDEFARRVRELIRSTDLTTRTNQNTLWLLLPKTPPSGSQIVLNRILDIQTESEIGLQITTASYHAPSQSIDAETTKLLMARLQSEVLE
ncbi:MAG: diguanylate cyclase, partial [Sedimentisphaerales bacterium]|nr:diguanylate cyclase [Sedimentisphaerales bacterium]